MKNKGLGIVLGVVALFAIISFGTYNSLVTSEANVEAKWSQVENVMQRRYDLIPNLEASVKGSMKQEQKVFGDIAKARTEYAGAKTDDEKLKANENLQQASGVLVSVIREDYPELASNENVKTLMTQLEGSENRISTERRAYIQAVQSYNVKVKRFPTNIFANMFGYSEKPVYQAEDGAQKAPKVNFDE